MKYIKGLDTLRAFAVIIVIINHWGPHKFKSGILTFIFTKVIPDGLFGVDLFYVLSGYLITRILLNARQQASAGTRQHIINNFYIRRMLRIFPIYFLLVLTAAFIFNDLYVKNFLAYFLTYTSNFLTFKEKAWLDFSHTWSLAVEEQFYLVWPWVIIYSPQKYLFGIILSAFGLGLLSSIVFYYLYGPYFYVLLLPCITAFAMGAIYAYVELNPHPKKFVVNVFYLLLPICLLLLAVQQSGHGIFLIRVVYAIISINIIVYVTQQKYNRVSRFILHNKLLVNIGKVSYGIYLYHYVLPKFYFIFLNYLKTKIIFDNWVLNILTKPTTVYIIHLFILLAITILSYKFIEIPFLNLKKHFNYITGRKTKAAFLIV